jgi:hypothetical protein
MTQLEQEVLALLLDGADPVLATLRDQVRVATLKERRFTGVGFFSNYHVPDSAQRIAGNPSIRFGDVHAEIHGLAYGAGFVLFVDNGVITMLEGYTYDDPWPETISGYKLSYINDKPRDWAALRATPGWPVRNP